MVRRGKWGSRRNFQLEAKIVNSFAYHSYRKFEEDLRTDPVHGMGIREATGATLSVDNPLDEKGNVCHLGHNKGTVQLSVWRKVVYTA
jgi:hypothetical protein